MAASVTDADSAHQRAPSPGGWPNPAWQRCGRRLPTTPAQNGDLGISSSDFASSSTLTSLKVTTRTVLAKRAGR